ncbi:MAG: M15 family metallopeptidase [Armatimonadetes bacterium]|nr:M15 family metallopeptidase [Armatimonadota bacterium]
MRWGGILVLGLLFLAGCNPPRQKPVPPDRPRANGFPPAVPQEGRQSPDERIPGFEGAVVDSDMTRAEALGGKDFPAAVLAKMEVVKVGYLGFDGKDHQGQIVVDRDLAEEVVEIFREIRASGFPIVKVIPVSAYGWDDQASIDDQNSSGFNYRFTIGPGTSKGVLSKHAFGRAIDLNPYQNPFVAADGKTPRPYIPGGKGVLDPGSAPVLIFKRHGWTWGGDWKGAKDYQHFEKK